MKNSNSKKYSLDYVYIGKYEGEEYVYLKENNKFRRFVDRDIYMIECSDIIDVKRDIEVECLLKDKLLLNGLKCLLIDSYGNIRNCATEAQIIDMYTTLNEKKKLTVNEEKNLNSICLNSCNILTYLLGLNISNLNYNLNRNIFEVAVPATKLEKFKETLFEYLKSALLKGTNVIITNGFEGIDYMINRSLRYAGIKYDDNMYRNKFNFKVLRTGEISIDDICINKENKEFQKKIKL